jgi:hypothetical protein
MGPRFLQPLIAHFRPDLRQEPRVPFPLPEPSQIHGPVAPRRRQRHLGRGCRLCLDGTGLAAVTGDQVNARLSSTPSPCRSAEHLVLSLAVPEVPR